MSRCDIAATVPDTSAALFGRPGNPINGGRSRGSPEVDGMAGQCKDSGANPPGRQAPPHERGDQHAEAPPAVPYSGRA